MTNKAIFWDFDDTLVYDSKWTRSIIDSLDERHPGHGITPDEVHTFLREDFPWHSPDIYHPELTTPEAWWGQVRPLLARACMKVGFASAEADILANMAQQKIIDPGYYTPFEDTIPVLSRLQAEGWRHFILSNNFPELPEIVKGMPIAGLIEGTIVSGAVGYDKPNPGIFKYALELAGNPQKAWMVGDNVNADVRGAEAVGLNAILIRKPTQEKVKYYARNLEEAAEIIEANS